MIYLNENDIAELTDPVELTDQMVEALRIHKKGEFSMPDRMHMDMEGNTLLLMPAGMNSHFGTKLISLFPGNRKHNMPVINGLVILNDAQTGHPLAILNGAKLTAVRTAAVSAMGIRVLTPENVERMGLIGAGVQGLHQVQFAASVRSLKEVVVFDIQPEGLPSWTKQLKSNRPDLSVKVVKNPATLVESSELIITATNAENPVLPNQTELLTGKHVVAIGSYKPFMRELPDSLFRLIDTCWVDTQLALEESGDLIQPIQDGVLSKDRVRSLIDLLNGPTSEDHAVTSLFKTVGMALFDLFTARYLYEKAHQLNLGQHLMDDCTSFHNCQAK